MLSLDEYRRAMEVLFVELNHICLNTSENELRSIPRFSQEIDTYLAELRDPENGALRTLQLAFGFVDEYVAANSKYVITAAHQAYELDQSRSRLSPSD